MILAVFCALPSMRKRLGTCQGFLEMKAARAYQAAVSQFKTKSLLEAAARIMGDEVSHATILRAALGKAPAGFYSQIDEVE